MGRDRLLHLLALLLALLFGLVLLFAFLVSESQVTNEHQDDAALSHEKLEVNDFEHYFIFSYNRDMQLPELPTGCEATAISTLLRMGDY